VPCRERDGGGCKDRSNEGQSSRLAVREIQVRMRGSNLYIVAFGAPSLTWRGVKEV